MKSYLQILGSTTEARPELEAYSEDEINALTGKPVAFKMGKIERPFVA